MAKHKNIRLICFYLPQFHPIPENDAWWGKGFTEWRNVTKARPSFAGHYQPHLPADLGFYDLRVPEVREEQAALARKYGIYGFCYFYYWFNGKRLLQRPLDEVVESGRPNFPFCLCWANENWTRCWDGLESEILIAQTYQDGYELDLIRDLIKIFRDKRYIRIDNKPLFLVYRPELLPDPARAANIWRTHCRSSIGEIYLAYVQSFSEIDDPGSLGFDAGVEFPPLRLAVPAEPSHIACNKDFTGSFYDYIGTMRRFIERPMPSYTLFRTAMPSWDNTPRLQENGHIFINSSPEHYEQWLRFIIDETLTMKKGDERIVFINAWNEWAEGNHLEPDLKYGHKYLEATARTLQI